jgi:pimeloyl-ACP methyl ester carboxylesterase
VIINAYLKHCKLLPFIYIPILAIILSGCSTPYSKMPAPLTQINSNSKPSIDLQACNLGNTPAFCGTLRVFENRAGRSGRMIDLRVAVIKAQSKNPAPDPIFFLAGGPGQAATEDGTHQQFPDSLSANHDLVFVDQRGTGGSNLMVIPGSFDFSSVNQIGLVRQIKAWVTSAIIGKNMDPQFYTTSIAMDDMDEVREALGYDKINLVGYSYGATAAQYYLRQYEDHVRTVFLGGGSLLDIPVFERWALNGQQALDKIFNLCQADSSCHKAYPDLKEEFAGLMIHAATQPVTIAFSNKSLGSATLTPDYLAPVIRMMTKDAKNDPAIPQFIHRAYTENNWEGFRQFIETNGNYEWWSDQMMEHVIRCYEKWARFDPDEVARLSEGSYLKGFDLWLSNNQAAACQYTPRGEMPEGMDSQPGSPVPVLFVNGDWDPIDPPEIIAGAKELFPNSIALILPYQGHSWSDYSAITCMWSIQNEFIQNGSAKELDTSCLNKIQSPKFDTSK